MSNQDAKSWEDTFVDSIGDIEEKDLPSEKEFLTHTACPEWSDISKTVELATKAFAFDGFNPLFMARYISKRATGGSKQIAALVVLALEVGSVTTDVKVVAKGTANELIAAFGVQKNASGNSRTVTLPRVVLSFPGYAFQIIHHGKVTPRVTVPYWPDALSFPGSINVLNKDAKILLEDAYTMWTVVFGLTISQGTKNNKKKKVVEELSKVRSGEPVDDLTWNNAVQYTKLVTKTTLLTESNLKRFSAILSKFAGDLAKCAVAAKNRCLAVGPLDQAEVDKVRDLLLRVFAED